MTETEKRALKVIIQELESDVKMARTRDESMRLTRRVMRLREFVK